MGLTTFYLHGGVFDHAHEESSLQTIGRALDLSCDSILSRFHSFQTFGGGGGNFKNEELLGKAISRFGRDKFVIATKFGVIFKDGQQRVSGSEETI
jgi:hypothetical protein